MDTFCAAGWNYLAQTKPTTEKLFWLGCRRYMLHYICPFNNQKKERKYQKLLIKIHSNNMNTPKRMAPQVIQTR